MTFSEFISAISFRLWMPYWSLYALDLGASKEIIGVLSLIQAAVLLVLQVPSGLLADRLGRKKIILFSTVFNILTPFLYYFASTWQHLFLGVISQAVSWACSPALNAILLESFPEDLRGTGMGTYRLITWIPRWVMEFIGGLLLDRLGLLSGFKIILLWSTFASAVIFLIRAWGLRETIDIGIKDETRSGIKLSLRSITKNIWLLIVIGGLSSFAARIMMPFRVVYAVEVIGLSKSQWGLIAMVTGIMGVLIGAFGGYLSDRIGRKPCLIVSRISEPLSKLGFVYSRDFRDVFIFQSIQAVGRGAGGGTIMMGLMMGGPAWQALIADIVPINERGKIMGIIGSSQILIGLPSSWIGGYLWDNYSPETGFYVSALTGFIAAFFVFFLT